MAKKIQESKMSLLTIPEITDKDIEVVEVREIIPNYAAVRLIYNNFTHEYIYEIWEPELNENNKNLYLKIKQKFIEKVDRSFYEDSYESREKYIRDFINKIIKSENFKINENTKEKIIYYIIRDLLRYGKIDILMHDTQIEDISCTGEKTPVYIYHRKYESMKTNIIFENDEILDKFIIGFAQKCGKHISIANPLLDATLPDGSRLQETLAKEVTTRGSSFTIRRFKAEPLTPPDLVRFATMSPEMMAYCWLAVENHESMLISGGTASGKTTTLNAILLFIPQNAKIVSIEDTREINVPHPNWIAGLTRTGITGGSKTEVGMFELMKAAMRQRPEYIIVGEVRGEEAFIIFQAMATGKATYSTIHADSVQAIINRLENPPINLPRVLISALNIIILQAQVKVGTKMTRRIKKIVEIVGLEPESEELIVNTVFDWNPQEDKYKYFGHSKVFEKLMKKKNIAQRTMNEEFKRRTELIKLLIDRKITYYKDIFKIVAEYSKTPESVIEKLSRNISSY